MSEMLPKTWKKGVTGKEAVKIAYQERNLLALRYADGWYFDNDNNWEGWTRVLSLDGGKCCFHIPDEFEVGNLPKIEPNWDGHTTTEKWKRILEMRGIE